MARTFQPDNAGLRQLLDGPEVRAVLLGQAEKAKAFAEADAQGFRETGEYAGAFQVVPSTVTVRGVPRAAVRLENTAGHAAAVEWGYSGSHAAPHQPAHRTLGRALDSLR